MIVNSLLSRKRNYLYIYCFLPVVALLLFSCEDPKNEETFLSGKIINPHKDYVVLNDFNGLNDTIPLAENGSFSKTYKNLGAGLYTFSHPHEYQSIYLSPGDSVTLRLNTKAFDETIAFSGNRSKENNYLINLYIEIEKEDRKFLKNYQLSHVEFKKTLDSITGARLSNLEKLSKEHQFDEEFVCHAKQYIEFSSWAKMERFALVHYGKNDFLRSDELPENFYSYRKEFKINQQALLNNIAYRPYVNALISNLSFSNLAKELGSGALVNRRSFKYHEKRLHIIDSLFSKGTIKDIYAANDTQQFIMNRKNASEINDLVAVFLKMTDDVELKKRITTMAATYIKLDPGNEMPNIVIQNTDKKSLLLSDRVTKLSVLYFWSDDEQEYAIRVHDKIKDLKIKYPEIDFISINLDNSDEDKWEEAYGRYEFNKEAEYQILNTSPVTAQLALRNDNRSMVIDKNLTIIDPSINLFHYQIETTLLGYINR
ncbi:MAG: TlpA family protein disulfide reductase [Nonlabens sp.]|uniref:TlpA family protein disulfide reductase n=1 Tax=Nonlabens sp. TaxID=1888209 RepID=UPI003EF6DC59